MAWQKFEKRENSKNIKEFFCWGERGKETIFSIMEVKLVFNYLKSRL